MDISVSLKSDAKRGLRPTKRYKLFICENHKTIVFDRLVNKMIAMEFLAERCHSHLGLAAKKIRNVREKNTRDFFEQEACSWSPLEIQSRVRALINKQYENELINTSC